MAKIHAKQLSDNLGHRLKPLTRSPGKIIGSLSPTNVLETNGVTQVRRSPRSKLKLHLKAESSKPGSFVSVKTEDDQNGIKGEVLDMVDTLSFGRLVHGKSGKLQKQVKKFRKKDDPGNCISSPEKDCQDAEWRRETSSSAKGNKHTKRATVHSPDSRRPRIHHEVLKIKLSLPKSKNRLRSVSPRPKSPGSSSNAITKSPGSDKGSKKMVKRLITPSKERARALFVDPERDIDANSVHSSFKQSSTIDPSMPELQKQSEPLDYSLPGVQQLVGTMDNSHHTTPSTSPHPPSNPHIFQITKPYDSLRDIAAQFQFLNNNVHSTKSSLSSKEIPNIAPPCENDSGSDVPVKEDPDCYISSTQTRTASIQETALDMRCVKLE